MITGRTVTVVLRVENGRVIFLYFETFEVELVDVSKPKGKSVEPSADRPVVEVLELDVPSQTAVIKMISNLVFFMAYSFR